MVSPIDWIRCNVLQQHLWAWITLDRYRVQRCVRCRRYR